MKKLIFLSLLALIIVLRPQSLLLAVANDATESTQSDDTITDNIKKRLQDSLESATQNVITEKEQELPTDPRAFVGTVQDIIQDSISIATKDGIRYTIPDDDATILRSPGNSQIKAENIQINDFIIAMGYLQTFDKLGAKRIIVSNTITSSLNKTTGRAIIESKTSNSLTLNNNSNDSPLLLTINSKTIIKDKNGVIELEEVTTGSTIIYTATTDKSDNPTATIIMITSAKLTND